ncbi:hypothetical protein HHK36_003331 [Tetracentron sinense]|uniref:Uncharacterized protein n=1 Tax=Tetracentron sinense TaxID=13715 RepID=A0A835DS35_TETSI|nr:hypothetical protein HHK36_003331 [Tetracentron sinense]
MEGVGARLGRSSSRYGPTAAFSGPVRKWKKKLVHASPYTAANHLYQSNGNNVSHLLLYKWTPVSQSSNNDGNTNSSKDDSFSSAAAPDEMARRKFRYVPVVVVEEQKKEATEKVIDEAEASNNDPTAAGPMSVSDGFDGKPDINNVPMEESQASDNGRFPPCNFSGRNLDLSLGLKAHDSNHVPDPKTKDCSKESQFEREGSSGVGT